MTDLSFVFETFLEHLSASVDDADLLNAMAIMTNAIGLPSFAYLSLPVASQERPRLISNYPSGWTDHYLSSKYQQIDPVINRVRRDRSLFQWGREGCGSPLTRAETKFLGEAADFGIVRGFTIPIHDHRGRSAALTLAVDNSRFSISIDHRYGQALHLMAMCFHVHARKNTHGPRIVDGMRLTPREFECLKWKSRGKSAWDIGLILGISERTAAFHLENTRNKLGVRTAVQAVERFAEANARSHMNSGKFR